jgi:AraC-like DNA-binding protein
MTPSPSVDLHLRSYGRTDEPDRHGFAQLVLPLRGELLLEIEGRRGKLGPLRGAFVAPQAWHAQWGDAANQSIIVDLDVGSIAPAAADRLCEQPFPLLGAATRKLVEYMGLVAQERPPAPAVLRGWVPLLLDTLTLEAPRPASRLAALLARIEAEPGLAWTTQSMAATLGLSASRLHALFREEHDTTPHAWLLERRIALACDWLVRTDLPIAELAFRAGFSEQSALTRAMRNATGMTPAAWRRQGRENRSKAQ